MSRVKEIFAKGIEMLEGVMTSNAKCPDCGHNEYGFIGRVPFTTPTMMERMMGDKTAIEVKCMKCGSKFVI